MKLWDSSDRCTCTECRLERAAALPDGAGLAAERVAGHEELPEMSANWHHAFGAVIIVSYENEELAELVAGLWAEGES